MRRHHAVPLLALALAACAAPPIVVEPRFQPGDRRVYRLEATSTTTIEVPGTSDGQESTLVARSTVDVLDRERDGTRIRVTLSPERLTIDGRATPAPAEQRAELIVGTDGAVRRVVSVGDLPSELLPADVEGLAPTLATALPTGRVRLGERWIRRLDLDATPSPEPSPRSDEQVGRQQGTVSALRVVRGYDCVILSLATVRPITRERAIGDQRVRVEGTEVAATEMAFAFRRGFPVTIETEAEGRFALGPGGFGGGELVVETTSTLTLVEPAAR